jgi:hypothetical protein
LSILTLPVSTSWLPWNDLSMPKSNLTIPHKKSSPNTTYSAW